MCLYKKDSDRLSLFSANIIVVHSGLEIVAVGVCSESWDASVVWVVLEELFDLSEEIFLDLGGDKGSSLWKKLLNQIFQIDSLQSLLLDDLCTTNKS